MITLNSVDIPPVANRYIQDILHTKRLTYGAYTRAFEKKIAILHDNTIGVMVNSGTSALQIALHAAKIFYHWHDGDEILLPALTFVADANVILQNMLRPVFIDVHPDYFDIDATKIENAIGPNTRAILVSHLFGQAAEMDAISRLAKKHHLVIIEDACEAPFATYQQYPVGHWGDMTCFSTYAAHILTTGVGGMVVTRNTRLASLLKSLSFHGRDPSYLSIDDTAPPKKRFLFPYRGYSYRVSEIEGALGLAGLTTYRARLRTRQKNAAYLNKKLTPLLPLIQLPAVRKGATHSFMVFPIILNTSTKKLDDVVQYLEKHGIETRYLLPLLSQPCFRDLHIRTRDFPVAGRLTRRGFYVGCHPDLTKKQLDYIAKTLTTCLRDHA